MNRDSPDEGFDTDQPSSNQPPSRKRRLLLGVGLGLLVLFLATMLLPSPRVPKSVLTATADENEKNGYRQEGEITNSPLMSSHLTSLSSNTSMTSTKSSSHSNGYRFFDRTVAILNLSDTPLMQQVGFKLFESLRDENRFEKLQYVPAGETLTAGERLPEIFVVLDLESWEESPFPGYKTYEGEIVMHVGDRYVRSNIHHLGILTPPKLSFRAQSNLQYHGKQIGVESSGAKYKAVSTAIAEDFNKALLKLVDDFQEKTGSVGHVPDTFFPDHMAPPDFPFLESLDTQMRMSGPAFMRSCVAIWEVPNQHSPQEVVNVVTKSLESLGWEIDQTKPEDDYLRANHAGQTLEVYQQGRGTWQAEDDEKPPRPMMIGYSHVMNDFEGSLTKLFEGDYNERTLLLFQRQWYRFPKQIQSYFEDHPPTQSESWLTLAQLQKSRQPDKARESLAKGFALHALQKAENPTGPMKNLAEELDVEPPNEIPPEMIETLGIAKYPDSGSLTIELRKDHPVIIWLGQNEEKQSWLRLTARKKFGPEPHWTLTSEYIEKQEHGWSRMRQESGDISQKNNTVTRIHANRDSPIRIDAEMIDAEETIELTLRRSKF